MRLRTIIRAENKLKTLLQQVFNTAFWLRGVFSAFSRFACGMREQTLLWTVVLWALLRFFSTFPTLSALFFE